MRRPGAGPVPGCSAYLIAATDPVSVIATFREAGVRGRLRLLVEAESLLNDGTAAVGFAVALSVGMGVSGSVSDSVATLLWSIGGGISCGAAIALFCSFCQAAPRIISLKLLLRRSRLTDPSCWPSTSIAQVSWRP